MCAAHPGKAVQLVRGNADLANGILWCFALQLRELRLFLARYCSSFSRAQRPIFRVTEPLFPLRFSCLALRAGVVYFAVVISDEESTSSPLPAVAALLLKFCFSECVNNTTTPLVHVHIRVASTSVAQLNAPNLKQRQ